MIEFHHAPRSRSSSILWLIEELAVSYEMTVVDIRAPGGVPESYRAIQPNKKVPAVTDDGVTVTERGAICIRLADKYPEAGLAPAIGDPMRGPYLTWLVYCDSVLDLAVAARAHGLSYVGSDYSFDTFDDMVDNIERRLTTTEYVADRRFTAADTQLGSAVADTMGVMKVLPERPAFRVTWRGS